MAKKKHTVEQIIGKLGEAEVRLGQGETVAQVSRSFGVPDHIRSDNGPEFTATAVREWLGKIGVQTLFIPPGSPWQNGDNESFNGRLGDQLLKGEPGARLKP